MSLVVVGSLGLSEFGECPRSQSLNFPFKLQSQVTSLPFSVFCYTNCMHSGAGITGSPNVLVFFNGLITNKKTLTLTLNLDPSRHYSNHELIFHGYSKWQTNLTLHILGDYQLILWDKEQRQLFCMNTPFSTRPFYYHSSNDVFRFTNFFPILKQNLGALTLNPHAIATHLMGNFIQRPHDIETTCYKNILRLPPGYSLTFKDNKLTVKAFSHYSPGSIAFISRDQASLDFRERFTNAVKDYLPEQGGTGSQLSGGLDSSSVSLLAAQLLKAKNQTLTCFGVVPDATLNFPALKNWNLNDEALMQAAAKQNNNIKLELIPCDKPAIKLTDLAKFCYHFCESPAANVMNMTWIATILHTANQQDIHTLLNGSLGNLTISFKGKRHRHVLWATLARMKHALRSSRLNLNDRSLVNPAYALKHDLHPPNTSAWGHLSIQELFATLKPEHSPSYDISHALQLYFNVREYDPSTHPDVVNFCLNLPNDMYYHNGMSRCLIRESMQGILPEAIRLNTRRGTQCASWFYQLREALPYYKALLPTFKKNDLIQEIIDVRQMEALMNELPNYDPFKHEPMSTYLKFNSKLVKALHLAEWIHLHEEPEPWTFNPGS